MNINRPLLFFDLESTGLSIEQDRIIEIACIRVEPGGEREIYHTTINPGRPIPPEIVELTGIDNAEAAASPTFREIVPTLERLLHNADLSGYNLANFDVPLLRAEFGRLRKPLPGPHDRVIIDTLEILRKHEIRNLDWTHRFYFGRSIVDTHRALGDIEATETILHEQVRRYGLSGTAKDVSNLLRYPYLDSRRKLKMEEGRVVVCFGKFSGTSIAEIAVEEPSYLGWMLESLDPEIGDLLRQHLSEDQVRDAIASRQTPREGRSDQTWQREMPPAIPPPPLFREPPPRRAPADVTVEPPIPPPIGEFSQRPKRSEE